MQNGLKYVRLNKYILYVFDRQKLKYVRLNKNIFICV